MPAEKFQFPGPDSPKPLLFFSLTLLPLLAFLCWPDLFIRLYTGSGVESVKRSSAYCGPIALLFLMSLGYLALLASGRPDVAANPDAGWLTLALAAGGPLVLALAGVTVLPPRWATSTPRCSRSARRLRMTSSAPLRRRHRAIEA